MLKVICDIMTHCYDMLNTFIIAINFYDAKKLNCALMFNISNLDGRKYIRYLLLLEPCIDMISNDYGIN